MAKRRLGVDSTVAYRDVVGLACLAAAQHRRNDLILVDDDLEEIPELRRWRSRPQGLQRRHERVCGVPGGDVKLDDRVDDVEQMTDDLDAEILAAHKVDTIAAELFQPAPVIRLSLNAGLVRQRCADALWP